MRTRSQLPSARLSIIALVVAILVLLAPKMASAAAHRTFFVAPGGSDSAACTSNSSAAPFATIQKAIGCSAAGDAVSLAPSGANAYPGIGEVGHDVKIAAQAGAGARTVTIDAGQGELSVSPGATVFVSGVTLLCPGNDCVGKATVTNEGALTLSEDTVSGNQSLAGGVLNTTPPGSSTPASLTILDSTVSGNAARNGGGVQSTAGSEASGAVALRIVNSTIAENLALGDGGGVAVLQGAGSTAEIVNSTISGNHAQSGGGIYAASAVSLSNTLLAANTARFGDADCRSEGAAVSDGTNGHNLLGDGNGCPLTNRTDGDLVGVPRPGLLALADNGGATDTVALQSSSPAIGAGSPESCLAGPVSDLDQRGYRRRTRTRGCDVGALDTAGGGGAPGHGFYVAPTGSDAVTCALNSASAPFATIQRALACTGDGDVVNLAPSGSRPYPGIGVIADNVLVQAQRGANARTVTIDAGAEELLVSPGANVTVSGVTLTCPQNDCRARPTVTNEGTLALSQDALTGNLSGYSAILDTTPPSSATPASLAIAATTVSGNAGRVGGGVESVSGAGASGAVTLAIVNSTIAQNVSLTRGGGIAVTASTPGSATTILNSTITANTAQSGAGGLYSSAPLSLANTILAANTARTGTTQDCEAAGAPVTDGPGGHNLLGDGSGCPQLIDGIDGDRVGGSSNALDARLAPLGFDGGTTETAPPLPGSAAIAGGSAAVCQTVSVGDLDQRGAARNAAARNACEIGSYDGGGKTPVVSAPSISAPPTASATVAAPLLLRIAGAGSPIPAIAVTGTLPAGITLSDNGDGSASLTGIPAAGSAGVYQLTVTATNGAAPAASRSLTLTVAALAVQSVSAQPLGPARHRTITITGTGFQPGATLSASTPGIVLSAVKVKSVSTITARETVAPGTAGGAYDVTVALAGASATCSGCLTVAGAPATGSPAG
jgi:hypothetical protein